MREFRTEAYEQIQKEQKMFSQEGKRKDKRRQVSAFTLEGLHPRKGWASRVLQRKH